MFNMVNVGAITLVQLSLTDPQKQKIRDLAHASHCAPIMEQTPGINQDKVSSGANKLDNGSIQMTRIV